uniref:Uncharacterized protein n=1 Tax=Lepeophtheirus salmonis TaxID=72036 RepID=A0A0K2TXM9_LEPSM
MSTQCEKRIEIAAPPTCGIFPEDSSGSRLGASRKTIYTVYVRLKVGEDPKYSPGVGRKPSVHFNFLKSAFKKKPNSSIDDMARKIKKSTSAVSWDFKKTGGKSLRRIPRPMLTEQQRKVHMEREKKILNHLKGTCGLIVIFSDAKTFTVNPVFDW